MTASAGRPEGLAGRFGPGVISRQVAVRGAVLGGGVLSARAGADVHAFTLGPEQDEQFGGFWAGAAEPVRGAGVELGGLAGLHDEVKLGEAQPDAAGQHVHPLVALVGSQFGFALGGWEEHLVGAQPAGPLGQRDEGPAVAAYWLRPDTGVARRWRADELVERYLVGAGQGQQQFQGRLAAPRFQPRQRAHGDAGGRRHAGEGGTALLAQRPQAWADHDRHRVLGHGSIAATANRFVNRSDRGASWAHERDV